MDITVGSAVYSRAGRDKGDLFIVLKVEEDYVYLVDGKKRRIANPKKKKIKHLNKTNFVSDVCQGGTPEDYMIRNTLAEMKPI